MTVSDLAKSERLYSDVYDFEPAASGAEQFTPMLSELVNAPGGAPETSLLRTTNFQMLLMSFGGSEGASHNAPLKPAVPVNGPGIAHVCYQVDKKTETYQKFLKGGATHIGDIEMTSLSPITPVKYAYAHDIDGIALEIEHLNMTWLPDSMTEGFDRRIRHVSFATPDINRLVDFYANFMDVKKPRRGDRLKSEKMDKVSGLEGSELSMGWVHVGNMELEFIQYHSHPVSLPDEPRSLQALGYNMILLDVESVDLAKQKFVSAGGILLEKKSSVDGIPVTWGRDPDGNLIGLFSPPLSSKLSSKSFDYIPST
jgi:catechol 2,3-dioxygenase-like lactoylglutathione lyase family enzyme